jgi:uncharacterized protein YjiK
MIMKRKMKPHFHFFRPSDNRLYSCTFLILFLNSVFVRQCHAPFLDRSFPYDLHKPDKKYVLEQKLKEVSGLSFISENELALIQDETGSIFYYDLDKNAVTKRIVFGAKGDYEDLKVLGDSAYILRSDGKLFEVGNLSGTSLTENKFNTALSEKNNTEGLCYDDRKGLLLIACKGSPDIKNSGKDLKNKKAIYGFNPRTGLLSDTPYVLIDINQVRKISGTKYSGFIEKIIHFYTHSGVVHVFEPSGISIQPETRDLYVISSVGKVLVVINPSGKISRVLKLPPAVFKQPEGIAFDTAGNLYISNEGRNGNGNILKFNLQKDVKVFSDL